MVTVTDAVSGQEPHEETRPVVLDIQGDHLSGKPENVREFDSCQRNVRDFTKSQGNVMEKIL